MISLTELADCKTCEVLIRLIHDDAYADGWDDDDWWNEDDEDEPIPQQSKEDKDACMALMREALEYAAIGNLEEAKLRVRNRFHPKFHSLQECHALYKEAMAEKSVR